MVGRKALCTSRSLLLLSASLLCFCQSRYRSHLDCCFRRFLHYFTLMGFFIPLMCSISFSLPCILNVSSKFHDLISDRSCGVQLIVQTLLPHISVCSLKDVSAHLVLGGAFTMHGQMNNSTCCPVGFLLGGNCFSHNICNSSACAYCARVCVCTVSCQRIPAVIPISPGQTLIEPHKEELHSAEI